jgi:hypothetical protein
MRLLHFGLRGLESGQSLVLLATLDRRLNLAQIGAHARTTGAVALRALLGLTNAFFCGGIIGHVVAYRRMLEL